MQVVQLVAFTKALLEVPGGQAVQFESPADMLKSPDAHSMHEDSPDTDEKVPAEHNAQDKLLLINVPGRQAEHAVAAIAASGYNPAAHDPQPVAELMAKA